MCCDVGEVTERLKNELLTERLENELCRRLSDGKVVE